MHELTLFDRINLAKCAKERARRVNPISDRFLSEYRTARMWVKYRCNVTDAQHSFIDPN